MNRHTAVQQKPDRAATNRSETKVVEDSLLEVFHEMSRSQGTRQPLAVASLSAFCLSAMCGCTGLVAGTNSSPSSTGTVGSTGSVGSAAGGAGSGTPGAGTITSGGGASSTQPVDPGNVLIHRLNTAEYNNSVADVLGTSQQPGTALWASEETADFNNIAAVENVDDKQYQLYYDAAGVVAQDVFANSALKARIVTCETADDTACVQGIIGATGLKLFRRPLTAAEVGTYLKVYTSLRAAALSHDAALQQVLVALLASAEFLFRMEIDPDPTSSAVHALSPYELASRLSYFLWQSAPDEGLLKVAADGTLSDTTTLQAQLQRLSADAKFERFSKSFVGQWLGIRNVAAHGVDATVFPNWTPAVGAAMAQEAYSFFDEFAKGGRPWPEFITADVNYVDSNLAPIYGMPAPASGMQRVTDTTDQRVGFLGMGSFLALSSYEYRTAPTLRGRWILLNLLCSPPPNPPAGVPALDSMGASADAAQQNVRQRLEAHRANAICASCHANLDPYGLALENFDAIGQYRSAYSGGSAIDASTTLADGTKFDGLPGLIDYVSKQPKLLSCVENELFTYSLGREPIATDQPYLDQIQASWLTDTPTLPRLIEGLVLADTFRKRHGG
jgi:hypothetical protein